MNLIEMAARFLESMGDHLTDLYDLEDSIDTFIRMLPIRQRVDSDDLHNAVLGLLGSAFAR